MFFEIFLQARIMSDWNEISENIFGKVFALVTKQRDAIGAVVIIHIWKKAEKHTFFYVSPIEIH